MTVINKLVLKSCKWTWHLVDKVLFTITVILGMQLPAFISAYVQRLSGHLNEANIQLSKFKEIAEFQYQGDLEKLVSAYLKNTDFSIQQTGKMIAELINRTEHLQVHMDALNSEQYIERVEYFLFNFDRSLARDTLNYFEMSLPLTVEAVLTGIVIAICLTAFEKTCFYAGKTCYLKLNKPPRTSE